MSCHHEHNHDDDHIEPPSTVFANLFSYIDIPNIKILNAEEPENAVGIVRPNEEKLVQEPVLTTDADEELLISIPFIGHVKLHSVFIRSLGDDTSPKEIKLYKNNVNLDFDTVGSAQCIQTLNYPESIGPGITTSDGTDGIVQFAVNRPKFSNISSVTLHITQNYGAEQTKLLYLGFRGDFTELKSAPVIAQYEAAANPSDHKVENRNMQQQSSIN